MFQMAWGLAYYTTTTSSLSSCAPVVLWPSLSHSYYSRRATWPTEAPLYLTPVTRKHMLISILMLVMTLTVPPDYDYFCWYYFVIWHNSIKINDIVCFTRTNPSRLWNNIRYVIYVKACKLRQNISEFTVYLNFSYEREINQNLN